MVTDLKNGSNLLVLDGLGRILVVREKTREGRWMLPGGGVDRGESPRHAAQSETEEETGIITDEQDFTLIGYFVQRPQGVVFLYETRKYKGAVDISPDNPDSAEARFMSFEEIWANREQFRLAYLRMIMRYQRYLQGYDRIPYEGRLSDPVELLNNLPNGPTQEELRQCLLII